MMPKTKETTLAHKKKKKTVKPQNADREKSRHTAVANFSLEKEKPTNERERVKKAFSHVCVYSAVAL